MFNKDSRLQYVFILTALLAIWFGVVVLSLGRLIESERHRLENLFDGIFGKLTQQVQGQLLKNDLALEAFRAFLTAKPELDFERTRMFARLLLSQYPNIYMFEIAQRISQDERSRLEAMMRAAGYKDYVIHEYGYDTDRNVHAAGPQSLYQPIIFIEPELPEAKDVLGLDLNSTSGILGEAARQSYGKLEEVSSMPFELLEGERGYIIYGPVVAAEGLPEHELHLKSGLFALVVVKADSLLPAWIRQREGLTVRLRHTAAAATGAAIVASASNPPGRKWGLGYLFDPLQRHAVLSSRSQPFEISAEFQVCWEDVELSTIMSFVITMLVTLVLAVSASSIIYRKRMQASTQRKALYTRANYDLTTALPNKHLLRDRADQAIKQARRQNHSLALLFIDLDRFKAVNDQWGHTMGDEVLKEVGARISRAVREEDTVGRIHGDEFVVLLHDIDGPESVHKVVEKLSRVLDTPLRIKGIEIDLGMSIGGAVFPQDGEDFDTLLHTSDKRMYETKKTAKDGS